MPVTTRNRGEAPPESAPPPRKAAAKKNSAAKTPSRPKKPAKPKEAKSTASCKPATSRKSVYKPKKGAKTRKGTPFTARPQTPPEEVFPEDPRLHDSSYSANDISDNRSYALNCAVRLRDYERAIRDVDRPEAHATWRRAALEGMYLSQTDQIYPYKLDFESDREVLGRLEERLKTANSPEAWQQCIVNWREHPRRLLAEREMLQAVQGLNTSLDAVNAQYQQVKAVILRNTQSEPNFREGRMQSFDSFVLSFRNKEIPMKLIFPESFWLL